MSIRSTFHPDIRSFYRRLKEARSGFAPKTAMCRDADGNLLTDERKVIERWKCYFVGHLNGAETGEVGTSSRTSQQQQQHSNKISDSNSAEDEVPPPSLDEITSAIIQHKSNKATGSDGLAAEHWKKGPERLTVEMHQLITRIWEQEELRDQWKLGVIHPVYKKGDRLECSSYRAISVLNAANKILSQILFLRLAPLATDFVGSNQAGFVGDKSFFFFLGTTTSRGFGLPFLAFCDLFLPVVK
ncbi:uncharacterized protein LOC118513232 [Anopheles stephensi]|uniref:uncharacterized protein LOC118513232 n=1 Tax=Anopheles stephensi TaxID=30069 RepID=UPI00165889E3|nr:uncharacterized protein LOC118513232 [Anopheles stephensi]